MNEFTPWLNTVLLVFILWFQWNRNKTLSERIDHQTKLVQDTKSVVTQQATALESQAKVVETAVRYSEAFDPGKMENVLKKKIEIESLEKITDIEKEYKRQLDDRSDKNKKLLNAVMTASIEASSNAINDHMSSFINIIISLMVRVPKQERDTLIADLPESSGKAWLKEASEKIEVESINAISQLLAGNSPNNTINPTGR